MVKNQTQVESKFPDLDMVIEHPTYKNPETVKSFADKELPYLLKSLQTTKPLGFELRRSRSKPHAFRFRYQGAGYDIRKGFRRYVKERNPQIKIPPVPRGRTPISVNGYTEILPNGKELDLDISCLERCSYKGVVVQKTKEILSEAQAIYVFGCMERGVSVDPTVFDSLYYIGKNLWDAIDEWERGKNSTTGNDRDSQNSTTGDSSNSQYSTTAEDGDSQYSTTGNNNEQETPISIKRGKVTVPTAPQQYSTTGNCAFSQQSTTDAIDLIPSILAGVTELLGRNLVKQPDQDSKSLNLDGVQSLIADRVDQIFNDLQSQFEKGILLNQKGEEFLIQMFDFLDHHISNGSKKSDAYRAFEEEMNNEGSDLYKLKVAFMRCKLGANKGKEVTYYDIETYYNKWFSIFEGVIKGQKVRRIVRTYN